MANMFYFYFIDQTYSQNVYLNHVISAVARTFATGTKHFLGGGRFFSAVLGGGRWYWVVVHFFGW